MDNSEFPEGLKLVDITTTILKKWSDKIQKLNTCECFANSFNVFWKINAHADVYFVEKILSLYMCGFRKGFSTQKAALFWLKHGKKYLIERDMGVQYSHIYQRPLMQRLKSK